MSQGKSRHVTHRVYTCCTSLSVHVQMAMAQKEEMHSRHPFSVWYLTTIVVAIQSVGLGVVSILVVATEEVEYS